MIELIFVENEIEASIFTDSIVDSVNKKIIVDVSEIFNQQNPDFFNKLYQIFLISYLPQKRAADSKAAAQ